MEKEEGGGALFKGQLKGQLLVSGSPNKCGKTLGLQAGSPRKRYTQHGIRFLVSRNLGPTVNFVVSCDDGIAWAELSSSDDRSLSRKVQSKRVKRAVWSRNEFPLVFVYCERLIVS